MGHRRDQRALLLADLEDLHHEGDVVVLLEPVGRPRGPAPTGRTGRKLSRRLILALRICFMSARRGSQTIERSPSARGPHSIRPWNQPTTWPSATAAAVSAAERGVVRGPAHPAAGRGELVGARRKQRAQLVVAVARPPEGVVHHERPRARPAAARPRTPRRSRRPRRPRPTAHRPAGTASCRRTLPLATELAAQPPASARSVRPDLRLQRADQVEERLLVHRLDRAGDVAVAVLQRLVRASARAQQVLQRRRRTGRRTRGDADSQV